MPCLNLDTMTLDARLSQCVCRRSNIFKHKGCVVRVRDTGVAGGEYRLQSKAGHQHIKARRDRGREGEVSRMVCKGIAGVLSSVWQSVSGIGRWHPQDKEIRHPSIQLSRKTGQRWTRDESSKRGERGVVTSGRRVHHVRYRARTLPAVRSPPRRRSGRAKLGSA